MSENAGAQRKPLAMRVLDGIERAGNALPDATTLFFIFIGLLVVVSIIGAALGWSAVNPGTGATMTVTSLIAGENVRKLLEEMPRTLTNFAPLGTVLVMMLGTGIAEKSGYFGAALRGALKGASKHILTPLVVFLGCMSSLAVDAGYVVLVPLGAAIFAAAGRHPIAGLAAAFAGVSGGFSANLFPSSLDALLLGITQEAARIVDPSWTYTITDNYWLIIAFTFVVTAVGWVVTDRIVEPRLGVWSGHADRREVEQAQLSRQEKAGVTWGTIWLMVPIAAVCLMALPGGALRNVEAGETAIEQLGPFFAALVAALAFAFFLAGLAYGICTGRYRNDRDAVADVNSSMSEMGAYIVLAFAAAHFIAMFNWSGLGAVMAINGAEGIKSLGLPGPLLFMLLIVMTASINLLVGSASAKWGMLAPIFVPMFMLMGYSPEAVTGAYRLGDSSTNIITPLMAYFPMALVFAQRYVKDFGIGSMVATMLPYSIGILIASLVLIGVWIGAGWDLGPGAPISYTLPVGPAPAVP
jgi:aminobenzoyl-glutamate transport protein